MLRCIIVDDDPKDSERLFKLLKQVDENIEVISVCKNVESSVIAINKLNPDLLFLDVELELNEKGYDILKKIEVINFDVIFTTSHINIYISEIRLCCLCYLAKPIIVNELRDAIDRFKQKKERKVLNQQINILKSNLITQILFDKQICLSNGEMECFIKIKNVYYCESQDPVTKFYVHEGGNKLVEYISYKRLKEWEMDFKDYNILKIHQRTLVNLDHVQYFRRNEDIIIMENGSKLEISRTYKQNFLDRIK